MITEDMKKIKDWIIFMLYILLAFYFIIYLLIVGLYLLSYFEYIYSPNIYFIPINWTYA